LFPKVVNLFHYCPVFKLTGDKISLLDSNSYTVSLEPLKPLTESSDTWGPRIGFDSQPDEKIGIPITEYKDAFNCQKMLRFDGNPPTPCLAPCYKKNENPKVSTGTPLPHFARLDFQTCPMSLQPTDCLKRWLLSQGIVHRHSETRKTLVELVEQARKLPLTIFPPSINIKDGKYSGFEILSPRVAGDPYDTWNRDYMKQLRELRVLNDREVNIIFGKGVNGVRERGQALVEGGNYRIDSLTCRNVMSKDPSDRSDLVVFRCNCRASQKPDVYIVHLVFEQTTGGSFRSCPYSTCSCRDGELFCSHMIGLIVILGLAQIRGTKMGQEAFEERLPEDPKLVQSQPTLTENFAVRSVEKRKTVQLQRQTKLRKR